MKIEAQYTNACGIQQSNSTIKVYRYKCSHQNYRKISNEKFNFTLQGTKTEKKIRPNLTEGEKIGHKIMK